MKNYGIVGAIILIFFIGIFWGKKLVTPATSLMTAELAKETKEVQSYWTCPMHPQIHSDHPGECPICHMKLVQVKAEGSHTAHVHEEENRSVVVVSPDQMKLLGIQKTLVEKMDLTAHIPIAGRFISGSSVAFQVYESDLKYVRAGLHFTGESSFRTDAKIQGVISSVDSIVDPSSRTVRVVGSIRQGPSHIIPETTFRGDIAIELKGVMGIPESSVLHTGDSDIVYLVQDDDHLIAQKVKLGLKTESYFEVVAGLEPDQYISSGPNFLIDSEAKIRGVSQIASTPKCPSDQHWDIPMAMCMPGKEKQ